MGYDGAPYVGNSIWLDINEYVNEKTDTIEYILLCTTEQSHTFKGEYRRRPYTFKIREWKSSNYVEKIFVREVVGDVRQLLKLTIQK
jgi:hypothetical protein